MANYNPPEANRFKKGQSGNPSGRPKLPKELAEIKVISSTEVKHTISKCLRMNRLELHNLIQDPKSSVLELSISSGLTSIVKYGDLYKLSFLLDRVIGRIKQEVVVATEAEQEEQFILENMPLPQLRQLARECLAAAEKE